MQVGLARALVSLAAIVLFRTRARSSPARSPNRVPAPPSCINVGPAHPRRTTHRGVVRCTSMRVYTYVTVQLHPHSTVIYYHSHRHDLTHVRYVPLVTSGLVQANSEYQVFMLTQLHRIPLSYASLEHWFWWYNEDI